MEESIRARLLVGLCVGVVEELGEVMERESGGGGC